jgi:cytochrome b involved in lipid metabolism
MGIALPASEAERGPLGVDCFTHATRNIQGGAMPIEASSRATSSGRIEHETCSEYVQNLKKEPPLEGHLSKDCGFLRPEPTRLALPSSHGAWDRAAAELPALFGSNRAQQILADLPSLSGSADVLADEDLTRASVVLSALAHAYWRFGADRFFPQRITQVPSDLPASIALPWCEITRRLGRGDPTRPFQNFYDLFLCNYRLAPHAAPDAPRIIENLEVLVPSFGNEAERIFYMSFVEMHHQFAPVVGALCDLDDAVRQHDVASVVAALAVLRDSCRRATGVWNKISPRKGSALYVDPVLWSKTAAILGVPPSGCSQGATSGACAPVLFLLDAFLERAGYESHYGQFLRDRASALVAPTVHELARRVRRIALSRFIAERYGTGDGHLLEAAYSEVLESYTGRGGWLDRHTAKVFNYLCISTVTGRNASVSGDERYFERQTWVAASAELHESRGERAASSGCPHAHGTAAHGTAAHGTATPALPRPELPRADSELPLYGRADVARHHRSGDTWLVIDDYVCDVSRYMDKHPGGDALLRVYAGQDVTEVFWAQSAHFTAPLSRLLRALVIGRVAPRDERQGPLFAATYALLRARQSLLLQYEHPMQSRALKLLSDENAHMMLWQENLPAAFAPLDHDGWQRVLATPAMARLLGDAQRLSRAHDLRELTPALAATLEQRSRSLAERDGALADALIATSITELERWDPATPAEVARWELAERLCAVVLTHLHERELHGRDESSPATAARSLQASAAQPSTPP